MRSWLKNARTAKGLTQKELGEQLGISESYYCAIEAGDRQKKLDLILASAISDTLSIPLAEIVRLETS